MKRTFSGIILLILCFSLIAIAVQAAGSSGGSKAPVKKTETAAPKAETKPDCEIQNSVFDRVKCRLANGNEESKTHESCRGLSDEAECQKLYDAVYPCYSLNGKEKDKCFRKIAGFQRLNSMTQQQKNQYALFLLYDLEEKVEDAYKEGKINEDMAANLVTKIIAVKKTILEKKSKEETKARLAELKQVWVSEVQ